jgi:hypothetical protein
MKYPTLTQSACQRLANLKIRGLEAAVEPDVAWVGSGEELDLEAILNVAEACNVAAEDEHGRHSDRDQVEGILAADLWDALSHVPVSILDDPGFWRYLSIALFWDFIAWREETPFAGGNHLKYLDGTSSTEAVLPRMYLRASAVGGSEYRDLAGALPNATDFWRSHVIRVRTGTAPPVTREFVRSQSSDRLTTNPLRELAKGINRTWTNTVPQLLDEREAKEIIVGLRRSLLDESPSD